MSEGPELPELHQGLLDPPTLQQLFVDLQACTQVLDVLLKGGREARTDGRPVPLHEARELLEAGAVRGVQVRYRYEGAEWRDTLIRGPEGVRIVRMRMPGAMSG